MATHLLLGLADESGHFTVNAGSSDFEDFVIDLPDDVTEFDEIQVNAENCSIAFSSILSQTINQLTIKSTSALTYNGGATVRSLTVEAKDITFNCSSKEIETVVVKDYNQADNRVLREQLQGVCWTPGSGSYFAEGSKYAASSLADLRHDLPAVRWVAPEVTWAASGTNIRDCTIYPALESVADQSLWAASSEAPHYVVPKVISHQSGKPNFGRSYSDEEIVSAFKLAHDNGFNTCFSPSLLVDSPSKDWRGFITGDVADIERFYNQQYEPFILHYAQLLKGKTDAFIIGSELKGLTSLFTSEHKYPFVDMLISLADKVKHILGAGVFVTYDANWAEYHHADGGYRPLDALWASPSIDVVAFTGYFPLTSSKSSSISKADIKAAWTSGEAYDYYLDGATKRELSADWAHKNIAHWWNSEHWSTNPTDPSLPGVKTPWEPRMKKIWITGFGCGAIDKGSNHPYIFYDPSSPERLPSHSTGQISIEHMLNYYAASLEYFASHRGMVELAFAARWDARGSSWYSEGIWGDSPSWTRSHSLEGKLPSTKSEVVIQGNLSATYLVILQDEVKIISPAAANFAVTSFTATGKKLEIEGEFRPTTTIRY